jgi:hypothetical protein
MDDLEQAHAHLSAARAIVASAQPLVRLAAFNSSFAMTQLLGLMSAVLAMIERDISARGLRPPEPPPAQMRPVSSRMTMMMTSRPRPPPRP